MTDILFQQLHDFNLQKYRAVKYSMFLFRWKYISVDKVCQHHCTAHLIFQELGQASKQQVHNGIFKMLIDD